MKRGKCELCRAVADLHDSHYLPKSGYKKIACERPEESKSGPPFGVVRLNKAHCRSGTTNFAVLRGAVSIRAARRGF